MLRNNLMTPHKAKCGGRNLLTKILCMLKSTNSGNSSINRQGKIISKLFGNRLAGSKKRWYPTTDASSSCKDFTTPGVVFHGTQFGKSNSGGAGAGNGKNSTRRMSVLNKLFMEHITDLLATGQTSETILGHGMQVSRVKVTSDFACMNVYWLGSGDVHADAHLEVELQRCSGILRHELSQLRLMGEVPRIKFVRDRQGGNINQVEGILRTIDFDKLEIDDSDKQQSPHGSYDVAQTMRREFYGCSKGPETLTPLQPEVAMMGNSNHYKLPEMRHDVLGLDHRDIMTKILTKMRKTRQAWEDHKEISNTTTTNSCYMNPSTADSLVSTTELASIQRKLREAAQSADKFDNFLARRRDRKQTPERKKHRREDNHWSLAENRANSDEQFEVHYDEDYILEDEQHQRID